MLQPGRIAAMVIDDMLVGGKKYPIVSDTIQILIQLGFSYRETIIWKKPDGYVRMSARSGTSIQHPYPMYYHPDNIVESIVIVSKGKFEEI